MIASKYTPAYLAEMRDRVAASQARRREEGRCLGCGGLEPCPNAWRSGGAAPRGMHSVAAPSEGARREES